MRVNLVLRFSVGSGFSQGEPTGNRAAIQIIYAKARNWPMSVVVFAPARCWLVRCALLPVCSPCEKQLPTLNFNTKFIRIFPNSVSFDYLRFLSSGKLPNYMGKPFQRCIILLGSKLIRTMPLCLRWRHIGVLVISLQHIASLAWIDRYTFLNWRALSFAAFRAGGWAIKNYNCSNCERTSVTVDILPAIAARVLDHSTRTVRLQMRDCSERSWSDCPSSSRQLPEIDELRFELYQKCKCKTNIVHRIGQIDRVSLLTDEVVEIAATDDLGRCLRDARVWNERSRRCYKVENQCK